MARSRHKRDICFQIFQQPPNNGMQRPALARRR